MRRYEKKKDEEIRNYDPFGRGGGGAPMRDKYGNIIGEFPPPPTPGPHVCTVCYIILTLTNDDGKTLF